MWIRLGTGSRLISRHQRVCDSHFAGSGSGWVGVSPLVAEGPRAAPRRRLHGPHTTSTSRRRIGLPAALRAHAVGVWSVCRSVVAPQSLQNGWRCRARLDSLVQAQS